MSESVDYVQAFKLADRYTEYQLKKSWGIIVIVNGIIIAFGRLQWPLFDWFIAMLQLDRELLPSLWQIVVPAYNLLAISSFFLPPILTITTYLSTKKTTIEGNQISGNRLLLYGLALFSFYFNIFWLGIILQPLMWVIFFPQHIVIEDNLIGLRFDSILQGEAYILLVWGFSCLISYLLLTRIVKYTKFTELLVPGAILILFSFISILFYVTTPTPPSSALEQFTSWINTIIIAAGFVGSGLYSVRQAYQILEGRE